MRKDIITTMKKNLKELDNYELDELINLVEEHAVEVEDKFIKMFSETPQAEEDKVPVFDFEIN